MMMYRYIKTTLLSSLIVVASLVSSVLWADTYEIDLSHTAIQFKTGHLGYSVLTGRFNKFSGTFNWDENNPSAASIFITIDTASVDSNWAERDKHLRDEQFLNVKKYPEATFKSTQYIGDGNKGKMEGILTLRGVSKPIVLDVERVGQGQDPWGGYRAGFKATTSIKRADFGNPRQLGPSSEVVEFDLFVEGIRK